jgi:cell division protein FtsB
MLLFYKAWHASGIFPSIAKLNEVKKMNQEKLYKKISELESINDQLQAEIRYLDKLLREVGFEEGLKTLKFAAKELIEQDKRSDR